MQTEILNFFLGIQLVFQLFLSERTVQRLLLLFSLSWNLALWPQDSFLLLLDFSGLLSGIMRVDDVLHLVPYGPEVLNDLILPQLSPHQVAAFNLLNHHPPVSVSKELAKQLAVVPLSNVYFVFLVELILQFYSVREVNQIEEVLVVVYFLLILSVFL